MIGYTTAICRSVKLLTDDAVESRVSELLQTTASVGAAQTKSKFVLRRTRSIGTTKLSPPHNHTALCFRIRIDIALCGPQVGVAGQLLNVLQGCRPLADVPSEAFDPIANSGAKNGNASDISKPVLPLEVLLNFYTSGLDFHERAANCLSVSS